MVSQKMLPRVSHGSFAHREPWLLNAKSNETYFRKIEKFRKMCIIWPFSPNFFFPEKCHLINQMAIVCHPGPWLLNTKFLVTVSESSKIFKNITLCMQKWPKTARNDHRQFAFKQKTFIFWKFSFFSEINLRWVSYWWNV